LEAFDWHAGRGRFDKQAAEKVLKDAGYSPSRIRECVRLLESGDGDKMLSLAAPAPLDWLAEGRLLHQIGCGLSKSFDDAAHVIKLLRNQADAPPQHVRFRACVDALHEDSPVFGSLTPANIQVQIR